MCSRIRPYARPAATPTGGVMVSAEAEEGIDLRESGLYMTSAGGVYFGRLLVAGEPPPQISVSVVHFSP